MRCIKAREAIVLEAGGTAAEAERLARHLERCDECRRFAAAEVPPLVALRTPVPLREFDYAAVRARVRAELARPERRRGFRMPLRLAMAVTIVALAGGALFLSLRREAPSHPTQAATARPSPALALTRGGQARSLPSIASAEPPPPSQSIVSTHPRTPHLSHRGPAVALVHQALQPELRIQIQTADPDIRIIWIANPVQPSLLKEKSS
jgi:hypothetical protein